MRTCGTELSPAPGNPARAGMPRHAQPSRAPVHSPGPPDLPASPRPRMAAALSSLTPARRTPFCRPRRGAAAARHGRQAGRHGDATAATDGAGARTSGECRTPCCPCRGSCALECPPSLTSVKGRVFIFTKKTFWANVFLQAHFFAGNVNRPRTMAKRAARSARGDGGGESRAEEALAAAGERAVGAATPDATGGTSKRRLCGKAAGGAARKKARAAARTTR